MSGERKARATLFLYSVCVLLIVLGFTLILNLNESAELRSAFRTHALVLGGVAAAAFAAFFLFCPVFDQNGRLMRTQIVAMLLGVVLIIQIAFAFAAYTSKNMQFTFSVFTRARALVDQLDQAEEAQDGLLQDALTEAFSALAISDANGRIVDATQAGLLQQTPEPSAFTYAFRLYSGGQLFVRVSDAYRKSVTTGQLANQAAVLIVSMLFSAEFALFAIKRVEQSDAGGARRGAAFENIRQLAFLFYFASRLSSSFITVMARGLPHALSALDANVAAGLPQTADTFFTCISLLFVSRLLKGRGWRPPFVLGLGLVLLGTVLSALSQSLLPFILARGVVGLGYGFCWMTLRAMALLGRDAAERSWGFAMLNAGIYVGMLCGSTIGSILAGALGERATLLLSAGLLLLCGGAIMRMENQPVEQRAERREPPAAAFPGQSAGQALRLALFALLMIAPGCIAASFTGCYLPLYYQNIGRGVLEVGRAQLLYGLLIVYAGPYLSAWAVKRGSLLAANFVYNLLLAGGLILLGLTGGFAGSLGAVLLLGLGDSFGFGVQNNYVLSQPFVQQIGESRALSYLSLYKKLMEMAGPTLFALTVSGASVKGVLLMGVLFLLAAGVYAASGAAARGVKRARKEAQECS